MEGGMSVQLRPFREVSAHGLQICSTTHLPCSPVQLVIVGCMVSGSATRRTIQHCAIWGSLQVGANSQRTRPTRLGRRDGTTAGRERPHSPLCNFHQNASDQDCGLQSCRGRVSSGRRRNLSGNCPQSARNTSQWIWAERVDLATSLDGTTCRRKTLHRINPQEAHLLAARQRYPNSAAYRSHMRSEHDKGALQ